MGGALASECGVDGQRELVASVQLIRVSGLLDVGDFSMACNLCIVGS